MKKYLSLFIFCVVCPLKAGNWPSKPSHYVSDLAGIIQPSVKTQIENLLSELERKTTAQVAVVTVKGLDGQDVGEAANQLFQQWGIGKKGKNNGVLFLISPSDRKTRIEVGYGLEGILPDGFVGRLIDQYVIPDFRAGDYSAGILKGTSAIAFTIANDAGVSLQSGSPPIRSDRNQQMPEPTIGQKLIAVLILVLIVSLLIRHPWLLIFFMRGGGGGYSSGGGFGGGFGGFGGGSSGGGGASRGW